MARIAAVGVDDVLAAGQTGVALRAADDKTAGRVDQKLGVLGDHVLRQHGLDHLLDDRVRQFLVADVFTVLGRDHDGVDVVRFAVNITNGDLRLRIGARPRQTAVAAKLGVTLHQTVRVINRHRHQLRRFIAGKTEHQALVAGALVEVEALAFVHALRDVGRLFVVTHHDAAALVVKADFGVVVADLFDDLARNLGVIDAGAGGDLTGEHDKTGMRQRFSGDTAVFVLREDGVKHRVGNLVGDFVGMAFGNGFGSEQEVAHDVVCDRRKVEKVERFAAKSPQGPAKRPLE